MARLRNGASSAGRDRVAREDPLQLLVDGLPVGILMRTPGSDLELALGLMHSEGVLHDLSDIGGVRLAPSGQAAVPQARSWLTLDPTAENLVEIRLARQIPLDLLGWQRALPSTSACGICGAATLDALRATQSPVVHTREWDRSEVLELPERLRAAQRVFSATGGLHAAGLLRWGEKRLRVAEDVGRHNAVDKLVGSALLRGALPLTDACLVVSGRAGFEIVQKAAAAQISVVASISAPSSLAVQTAEASGVTLLGFVREGRANVYSHPERLR